MKSPEELLKEYLKSGKSLDEVLSDKPKLEEIVASVNTNIIQPQQVKEETKRVEEPKIVERIIERESIANEKIVELLTDMKEIKSDIEMLKEALVEILNKTVQHSTILQEKLKSMNKPTSERKELLFKRDAEGKICGAELIMFENKEVE